MLARAAMAVAARALLAREPELLLGCLTLFHNLVFRLHESCARATSAAAPPPPSPGRPAAAGESTTPLALEAKTRVHLFQRAIERTRPPL